MQYIFGSYCEESQAWSEQTSEHEACMSDTAFPGNFTLSLLPFPAIPPFFLQCQSQRGGGETMPWSVKEKEADSDCNQKYLFGFSVFWISPVTLNKLKSDQYAIKKDSESYSQEDESGCWVQTTIFMCVCVHVFRGWGQYKSIMIINLFNSSLVYYKANLVILQSCSWCVWIW